MAEQTYRGYRITPLGTFPMVKIQPPGSGEVPDDLKGNYTTPFIAKQAIDRSLSKLKGQRKKSDGKKDSASTD